MRRWQDELMLRNNGLNFLENIGTINLKLSELLEGLVDETGIEIIDIKEGKSFEFKYSNSKYELNIYHNEIVVSEVGYEKLWFSYISKAIKTNSEDIFSFNDKYGNIHEAKANTEDFTKFNYKLIIDKLFEFLISHKYDNNNSWNNYYEQNKIV